MDELLNIPTSLKGLRHKPHGDKTIWGLVLLLGLVSLLVVYSATG